MYNWSNKTDKNHMYVTCMYSPVHVVLVSLLVDQLSGLFIIFLVDQKKIGQPQKVWYTKKKLVYQKEIWSTKKKIWSTKKIFGIPKKNLVDQKNEKLTGQLVYQRD